MERMNDSVRDAYWGNMYRSNDDLGHYEPVYSNRHIASAISADTGVDHSRALEEVDEAMGDSETFNSIYPDAAETLAEILQSGMPVYLWTVGNPPLQERKVAAIRARVTELLTAAIAEEGGDAKRIMERLFHVSISEEDKMLALEDIFRELQGEGISSVYLTDDKRENVAEGVARGRRMGMRVAEFVRDNSNDGGSASAMRAHLSEAVRNGVQALITDVDDAIFNETGPDGRIEKMIKKVQQNLIVQAK